jgi:hypothetical protein
MRSFETTDIKQARRFRIAQFNGRLATFSRGGNTVTGLVQSVAEKSQVCRHAGLLQSF